MARNGSGTYSKVNTFTAGTTITASGHNQNWDDIATEMTNSVAADGQTPMSGPLKAASGTAAAPSLTFNSDPDTGFFRRGANTTGIAAGGVEVGYFDANTAFFGGALQCSATASFGAIGTANFSGPATLSATATFLATAAFTVGFIASATATFAGELIASATATFTTEAKVAGSAVVKQSDTASAAEMAAETSGAAKYVRADRVKYSPRTAVAWGRVTYSGGTPTLAASCGVSSITDTGTGQLTVTLAVTMADTNYAVMSTVEDTSTARTSTVSNRTTTQFRITSSNSNNGVNVDVDAIDFVVFGAYP